MLIKKANQTFQFWNYQDTRKKSFHKLRPPELPIIKVNKTKIVKGLISHHILLPLSDMPKALTARLRADLTLRNPEWELARKYGKGFVSYAIPEFVRFYSMDTQYLGLPRSVKMNYVHARFKDCGLKLKLQDIRPKFETVTFPEKGIIKPWFFQVEGINKILGGNICLKFRCGRGKTICTLMAVAKLRLKTLILVRTNILLSQWVDAIHQVFNVSDAEIGRINGKYKTEGLITVATEQSLVALPRSEKRRIGETYGHVVFDECLSYDTEILTKNGPQYIGDIIKDIEMGRQIQVLSFNESTQKKEYKTIKRGLRKGIRNIMEIQFDNRIIRCTPDHPFFVKGKGWTKAIDLQENDDILDSSAVDN